jgi:hypothetical protein
MRGALLAVAIGAAGSALGMQATDPNWLKVHHILIPVLYCTASLSLFAWAVWEVVGGKSRPKRVLPEHIIIETAKPVRSPRREEYARLITPPIRMMAAHADSTVFRECGPDEEDAILLHVCCFNSDGSPLSAQIEYEANGKSTRIHGCWMGQELPSVNAIPGVMCELILLATHDGESAIIDDRRNLRDAGSTVHYRSVTNSGEALATVYTFLGDFDGPVFKFRLKFQGEDVSIEQA